MTTLRSKLIRLANQEPQLRPSLLSILKPETRNEKWKAEEEKARWAALQSTTPCKCMGPTVTILDDGRGPILDVSYEHDIPPEDIRRMDRAISALGWRGWAYGNRGIAFKPTTVDLGEGY